MALVVLNLKHLLFSGLCEHNSLLLIILYFENLEVSLTLNFNYGLSRGNLHVANIRSTCIYSRRGGWTTPI